MFRVAFCTGLSLLFSLIGSAQKRPSGEEKLRQSIFFRSGDTTRIDETELNGLFELADSVYCSMRVHSGETIRGIKISSCTKYENRIDTRIFKLIDNDSYSFTISRIRVKANEISFSGRIISFTQDTGFILEKDLYGYMFIRKKFSLIINE